MKKIYYIAFVMACVLMHVSCSDNLNTNPTDQISGNVLFKDVEGGMVAMERCIPFDVFNRLGG